MWPCSWLSLPWRETDKESLDSQWNSAAEDFDECLHKFLSSKHVEIVCEKLTRVEDEIEEISSGGALELSGFSELLKRITQGIHELRTGSSSQ